MIPPSLFASEYLLSRINDAADSEGRLTNIPAPVTSFRGGFANTSPSNRMLAGAYGQDVRAVISTRLMDLDARTGDIVTDARGNSWRVLTVKFTPVGLTLLLGARGDRP